MLSNFKEIAVHMFMLSFSAPFVCLILLHYVAGLFTLLVIKKPDSIYKVKSNTIELAVHPSCSCILDLLCVNNSEHMIQQQLIDFMIFMHFCPVAIFSPSFPL